MATGNDHTVKAFDRDIGHLRALISQMGGLAEQAISDAMTALARTHAVSYGGALQQGTEQGQAQQQ